MALDAQIVSGGTTYRLKANRVRILINRNPTQAPLPSAVNPLLVDLGSFAPRIVIEGVVDETSATDGGVTVPSKVQLEDFVIDTSATTITFTVSGDAYVSKIAGLSLELEGAREDHWAYSLTLVTVRRT